MTPPPMYSRLEHVKDNLRSLLARDQITFTSPKVNACSLVKYPGADVFASMDETQPRAVPLAVP